MNCKQRRKYRRRWKYSADVDLAGWDEYIEMYDWCVNRFGKDNFQTTRFKFLFDVEDNLLLFHLKWGHFI